MNLLETKTDHIKFHLESINGLPSQVFVRRFVFSIFILQSNYDVHLLGFMFEIGW